MTRNSRLVGLICGAALMSVPGRSIAQELEMFEDDDFINPKELRGSSVSGGIGAERFFGSRLYGGFDRDYQSRNDFTPGSVEFLKSANNLYYNLFGSDFQTNVKLTALLHEGRDDIPDVKGRIQQAIYFSHTAEDSAQEALRCQVSWDFQKRRDLGLTNEFGFTVESGNALAFVNLYATGGLMYVWKPAVHEHYFSVTAQVPVKSWENGSNILLGIGGSVENDGFVKALFKSLDKFTVICAISAEIDVRAINSVLHLAYLPSYSNDRRSWNHEAGIYLDVPIYGGLF